MMVVDSHERRRSVLFIAGLTHSGTTLLDILLGRSATLVGLGEIVPLLRSEKAKLQEEDRRCSCGQVIPDCPFWSRVALEQRLLGDSSFESRYVSLLDTFHDVFGAGRIPVDSSKSMQALEAVTSVPDLEVKIIHMLRDVRGWVVSRRDLDARQKVSFWQRNAFARFLIWYFGNKRVMKFTKVRNLSRVSLGYESLVFDPDATVSSLLRDLAIEDEIVLDSDSSSQSHVILGNQMRLGSGKNRITYDYRWLIRRDWILPALLFPQVMEANTQWVYDAANARRKASDRVRADRSNMHREMR